MMLMNRWIGQAVACVALAIAMPAGMDAQQAAAPKPTDLRTQAEQSGFKEYTSDDNMMRYLQDVQATSLEMRLGTYGATHAERQLPYAIFSRPAVTQPWEAWTLGKPIIVLAAGVHGGERTLRASVILYGRELADRTSEANKLLDDLVILVVPQINPDGFSAQPNPTRGNTWGIDLNRDYMKLEQPEIAGALTVRSVAAPRVSIVMLCSPTASFTGIAWMAGSPARAARLRRQDQ